MRMSFLGMNTREDRSELHGERRVRRRIRHRFKRDEAGRRVVQAQDDAAFVAQQVEQRGHARRVHECGNRRQIGRHARRGKQRAVVQTADVADLPAAVTPQREAAGAARETSCALEPEYTVSCCCPSSSATAIAAPWPWPGSSRTRMRSSRYDGTVIGIPPALRISWRSCGRRSKVAVPASAFRFR